MGPNLREVLRYWPSRCLQRLEPLKMFRNIQRRGANSGASGAEEKVDHLPQTDDSFIEMKTSGTNVSALPLRAAASCRMCKLVLHVIFEKLKNDQGLSVCDSAPRSGKSWTSFTSFSPSKRFLDMSSSSASSVSVVVQEL